jgi:hypothetical protein
MEQASWKFSMADWSTRAFKKIVNVAWNDSGSEIGNRYEMNVIFVHEKSSALQMYLYLAAVYCACGCGIVRLNDSVEAERLKKFKSYMPLS